MTASVIWSMIGGGIVSLIGYWIGFRHGYSAADLEGLRHHQRLKQRP